MHVTTVSAADATGAVRDLYEANIASSGYVATDTQLFSLRPAVYTAWRDLLRAIRANLPLREYELATLAAARALESRPCLAAHGAIALREGILERDQLEALLRAGGVAALPTGAEAGFDPRDAAVIDLGAKVAADAHAVSTSDVARLRDLGFDDAEILDIALAAAARSFYSKVLDAMGVEPSPELTETGPLVEAALGRSDAEIQTQRC